MNFPVLHWNTFPDVHGDTWFTVWIEGNCKGEARIDSKGKMWWRLFQ